jgi:hypothetical protein
MSLFSRKPKNRRRRVRSKKPADAWDLPELKKAKPKKKAKSDDLVGQVYQLNAQIGAIENFLAKKNAVRNYSEQLKREGMIPPPDRVAPRRAGKKPSLSLAERRRYHAERSRNGIHFLFLFCLACVLAWWLIFSGV